MTLDRKTIQSLIDKGDTFLAHYGIKGQEWGNRRFQNEDGSLTPEGRKRYGLKNEYSRMSDRELIDAIDKKRTQNQYVEMRTADIRKKQKNRADLIRAISDVSGSSSKIAAIGVKGATKSKIAKNKKAMSDANITTEHRRLLEAYGKELSKTLTLANDADKISKQANKVMNEQSDKIAKVTVYKELKNAVNEARSASEEINEKELKKVVNRMILEKQYEDLVNPPKPSKVERGVEVVQSLGAVLSIVLTGILIAQGIQKLTGKGG